MCKQAIGFFETGVFTRSICHSTALIFTGEVRLLHFTLFCRCTEILSREEDNDTLLLFTLEVCIKFTVIVFITFTLSRSFDYYTLPLVIAFGVIISFAIRFASTTVFSGTLNGDTLLVPTLQMRITIDLGGTLFRTRTNNHDAFFVVVTLCMHDTIVLIFTEIRSST